MKKVLIAYVTKTGNTQEIAERLKLTLEKNGVQTDVQKISDVRNIEPYTCVLVGGPVQGMKWHPEALEFVVTHKNQFSRRLLGYFFSSYFYLTARASVRKKIDNIIKGNPVFPKADFYGTFGGRIEKPLPWIARLLFGVPKAAPIDTINWEEIEEWAKAIAEKVELRIAREKKILQGNLD